MTAASAPRKRGPRAEGDARVLLLDVAERLFAERGVDAVSLRSVCAAAGVASSALHYHFRSADDLLHEVLWRRSAGLGERTRQRLAELRQATTVTVAAVVDALLLPWLDLLADDPVGGGRFVNVVSGLLAVGDARLRPHLAGVNADFAAVVRRLPGGAGSPPRWSIAAKCLVHGLATGDGPQELRAFVIAGLQQDG